MPDKLLDFGKDIAPLEYNPQTAALPQVRKTKSEASQKLDKPSQDSALNVKALGELLYILFDRDAVDDIFPLGPEIFFTSEYLPFARGTILSEEFIAKLNVFLQKETFRLHSIQYLNAMPVVYVEIDIGQFQEEDA